MDREIGQCGNCGGSVVVPTVWMGVIPPVPTCTRCGATAKPKGPVIEMNPPRRVPPPSRPAPENVLINEATQIPVPKSRAQ